MMAVSKFLAGGVALATLVSAAPAAAQYYPGYGQPNVIGQVINQVLGGGYGGGYGVNSQAAVQRCAAAVEQRVNGLYNRGYNSGGYGGGYSGYGGYGANQGYGGYGGYGYAQPMARVLGVTSVERRSNNGLRVRGTATARAQAVGYGGGYGGYGGYGAQGSYSPYGGYGGYGQQQQGELTFRCNVDYRGYVTNVDIDRNRYAYGYRNY
jgi:hypothetical protein